MVIGLISSCSTAKIVFDVPDPAEIPLPEEVENILIINTFSPDLAGDLDDVKNLFEAEGEVVNRIASHAAVSEFIKEMKVISDISVSETSYTKKPGLSESDHPVSLSWQTIDSLCKKADADILVSLESFRSELSTEYTEYNRKTRSDNPKQAWSSSIAYDVRLNYIIRARLKTYATVAWRIYYPARSQILLDAAYTDSIYAEAEDEIQRNAERKLPAHKNAVEDVGYLSGRKLARKITQRITTVQRNYFKSGNDYFKQANDFVEMRYWDRAAEFWTMSMEDPEAKIAGSAKYNLALISEMNGNLDEAFRLAEQAWLQYKHKKINLYIQILKERINR